MRWQGRRNGRDVVLGQRATPEWKLNVADLMTTEGRVLSGSNNRQDILGLVQQFGEIDRLPLFVDIGWGISCRFVEGTWRECGLASIFSVVVRSVQ